MQLIIMYKYWIFFLLGFMLCHKMQAQSDVDCFLFYKKKAISYFEDSINAHPETPESVYYEEAAKCLRVAAECATTDTLKSSVRGLLVVMESSFRKSLWDERETAQKTLEQIKRLAHSQAYYASDANNVLQWDKAWGHLKVAGLSTADSTQTQTYTYLAEWLLVAFYRYPANQWNRPDIENAVLAFTKDDKGKLLINFDNKDKTKSWLWAGFEQARQTAQTGNKSAAQAQLIKALAAAAPDANAWQAIVEKYGFWYMVK